MSETTKSISYSASASSYSDAIAFELYQAPINGPSEYPSYADINLMMTYARSGKSAFSVLENNEYAELVGDNVHIALDFYARVNPNTMPYSLSLNMGTITGQEVVHKEYNNSIVLPMSDKITFPCAVDIQSFAWTSSAYNELGQVVPHPSYTITNNQLIFSSSVFAVARIKYTLLEHKYTANLVVPKTEVQDIQGEPTDVTFTVTEITPIVTAIYMDDNNEQQVETLTLEIPQVVSDFLAACPDDPNSLTIDWGTSDIGKTEIVTYYYSTCDGEILYIDRVKK